MGNILGCTSRPDFRRGYFSVFCAQLTITVDPSPVVDVIFDPQWVDVNSSKLQYNGAEYTAVQFDLEGVFRDVSLKRYNLGLLSILGIQIDGTRNKLALIRPDRHPESQTFDSYISAARRELLKAKYGPFLPSTLVYTSIVCACLALAIAIAVAVYSGRSGADLPAAIISMTVGAPTLSICLPKSCQLKLSHILPKFDASHQRVVQYSFECERRQFSLASSATTPIRLHDSVARIAATIALVFLTTDSLSSCGRT